jgi:hypothetical protein
MDKQWKRSEDWKREGKHFLVLVHHYVTPAIDGLCEEENKWCVYAYLYPKHWRFATVVGDQIWQEALENLRLHCGCTFLKRHYFDNGEVCSIQFGADYNHLHDERYLLMSTAEDARSVFNDADELFEQLSQPKPEVAHG